MGEAVAATNGGLWAVFGPLAKRGGVPGPGAVKRVASPSRFGESGRRHGGEVIVVVVLCVVCARTKVQSYFSYS